MLLIVKKFCLINIGNFNCKKCCFQILVIFVHKNQPMVGLSTKAEANFFQYFFVFPIDSDEV